MINNDIDFSNINFNELDPDEEELEGLEEDQDELDFECNDIVRCVIASLKEKQKDYCFKKTDAQQIITEIAVNHISCVYEFVYDREGRLDYVEFTPARFYKKHNKEDKLIEGVSYEKKSIPKDIKCVIVGDVKKSVNKYNKKYSASIKTVKHYGIVLKDYEV